MSGAANSAQAQKKLKIGDTELIFQSPMKINEKPKCYEDSANVRISTVKKGEQPVKVKATTVHVRRYNYLFSDFYFGMGLATRAAVNSERYFPVYYGGSFDLQTGIKFFQRLGRGYAIGTQIQYSFYSYNLENAANRKLIRADVPGKPYAEYFRTDNIGTAWINRFYLFRRTSIELGVYGDYTFSKKYVVKTEMEDGSTKKIKYHDHKKFNSLQAGCQAAINIGCLGVYAKYRLTDWFNHEEIALDPPRLTIGAMMTF